MDIDALIKLAEAYASHAGLKLTTVSTYACNDGKWLDGLKSGRAGCTFRKAHSVTQWFSDHWPTDLAWPEDVPRPSKTRRAA